MASPAEVPTIEVSWKNVRSHTEIGTWVGEGFSSAQPVELGFVPSIVILSNDDDLNLAISTNETNHLHLDADAAVTEAAERTDFYLSSGTTDGFVVADGSDEWDENTANYRYLAFKQAGQTDISWKNTRMKTEFGQYTGDGSTTGREIDTGFQADLIFIQTDGGANFWFGMNATNSAQVAPGLGTTFQEEAAVHTSANGFTVGDGSNDANQNTVTYNYVAIQLDGYIRVGWKDALVEIERGTYSGDGTSASGGRNITASFDVDYVFIQEDEAADSWVVTGGNETEGLDLAPSLADSVSGTTAVHAATGDGFTVGDGATGANESATNYNYFAISIG